VSALAHDVDVWAEALMVRNARGLRDALEAAGVRRATMVRAWLGATLGRASARGLWEPDEAGEPMIALPVFEAGEPIDAIAWRPGAPEGFRRLTGNAVVLGALDGPWDESGRRVVRLRATPQSWLAAGMHGVCVLDWPAFMAPLTPLDLAPFAFVCDCAALAERAHRAVEALWRRYRTPRPRIAVARPRAEAAA